MNRVTFVWCLALVLAGCMAGVEEEAQSIAGGDPARGREAIRQYGCQTCHIIPGVTGADAVVGPPLNGVGSRVYVGGLPNTPENLVFWIRHPQEVEPLTAMPTLGVSASDALDITAYLYTVR